MINIFNLTLIFDVLVHFALDHISFPTRVDFIEISNNSSKFGQDESNLAKNEFQINCFLNAQTLWDVVERSFLKVIRFCVEVRLDLTSRTFFLRGYTKWCWSTRQLSIHVWLQMLKLLNNFPNNSNL